MKIVFATNNSGKITELNALLADTAFEIVTQKSLGIEDAPETASTFVENALIKARNAAERSGLAALADDSGLVVNALNEQPGIYSARYAGTTASAADNNKKLLAAMKNIPGSERQCAFHCVLVFLRAANDPIPVICHGVWEGYVLETPRGVNGFGYDPLFFVESLGCSAAELPLEIKNQLSHRGKALTQLIAALN
jgi:XTP/dITP diphosphohydrolase